MIVCRDGRCERVVSTVAGGSLLVVTVQRSANLLCDNRSRTVADVALSADHERVYVERMKSLIDRPTTLEAVPRRAAGWRTEETGQTYAQEWETGDRRNPTQVSDSSSILGSR